jgi:hypothetical protein
METNNDIPGYVPPGEPKKWFYNGWFSRSFLLIAALFFFLPFMDIKCSGKKLTSIKGMDMVTGSELKPVEEKKEEVADPGDTASADGEESAGESFNLSNTMLAPQDDQKKIDPNVAGITAFASIILALLFGFFKKRIPVIVSGGFSLLSALTLFFMQVQVKNEMGSKLSAFPFPVDITIEFTVFYWLCLLCLMMATVFAFIRASVKTS